MPWPIRSKHENFDQIYASYLVWRSGVHMNSKKFKTIFFLIEEHLNWLNLPQPSFMPRSTQYPCMSTKNKSISWSSPFKGSQYTDLCTFKMKSWWPSTCRQNTILQLIILLAFIIARANCKAQGRLCIIYQLKYTVHDSFARGSCTCILSPEWTRKIEFNWLSVLIVYLLWLWSTLK